MLSYSLFYFLVSIGWLLFFSRKKISLKSKTISVTFLLGLLSAPFAGFAVHILQAGLIPTSQLHFSISEFAVQFFLVGPIEEFSKFLAVFLAAHRKDDFSNAYDGILLAISAALGFAGIENVLYLYAFGPDITIPRLLLGNLGHAAYSMFWGYALGVVMHEKAAFSTLTVGLLVASLLHGAYNYFLNFSLWGASLSLILTTALGLFLIRFLKEERFRQQKRVR